MALSLAAPTRARKRVGRHGVAPDEIRVIGKGETIDSDAKRKEASERGEVKSKDVRALRIEKQKSGEG